MQLSHQFTVEQLEQALQSVELRMRAADGASFITAPVCVSPMPLTRVAATVLPQVMPIFNRMIDRIARDYQYLIERVGPTDEFSRKLAEIVQEVYVNQNQNNNNQTNNQVQNLMLGIFRSDYLYDSGHQQFLDATYSTAEQARLNEQCRAAGVHVNPGWKQVEINTIASSFPTLSTRTGQVHRQLHCGGGDGAPASTAASASANRECFPSTSERDVITALERAHRHFCYQYPEQRNPVLVFVVQQGERNVGDQGLIRRGLEQLGVRVIRKSVVDLNADLSLQPGTNHAHVRIGCGDDASCLSSDGVIVAAGGGASSQHNQQQADETAPVSIFYFRSMYDLSEYKKHEATFDAFEVRKRIEQSMAIKCPSVPYHLCTWKSVQKHLFADPQLLAKFVPDPRQAAAIKTFMVPHFSLNDVFVVDEENSQQNNQQQENNESSRARILRLARDAIANPDKWIVKTLREGYGFIMQNEKMVETLTKFVDFFSRQQNQQNQQEEEERIAMEFVENTGGEQESIVDFARNHLLVYRIQCPTRSGAVLRNSTLTEHDDLESELGTYGAILSEGCPVRDCDDGGAGGVGECNIYFNVECGYLLRTKSRSAIGGGIMSGVAHLDSIEIVG